MILNDFDGMPAKASEAMMGSQTTGGKPHVTRNGWRKQQPIPSAGKACKPKFIPKAR